MTKLWTHNGKLIMKDGKLCTSVPDNCCCVCDPMPETFYVRQFGTSPTFFCEECEEFWSDKKPVGYDPSETYPCRWTETFQWSCGTISDVVKIELILVEHVNGVTVSIGITYKYLGETRGTMTFTKIVQGDFDCEDIGDVPPYSFEGLGPNPCEWDETWACTATT